MQWDHTLISMLRCFRSAALDAGDKATPLTLGAGKLPSAKNAMTTDVATASSAGAAGCTMLWIDVAASAAHVQPNSTS